MIRISRHRVRADAARGSRRQALFIVGGVWFALSCEGGLLAQSTQQPYRIGYLAAGGPSGVAADALESFRAGMRDLGYVEGRNLALEIRYARGRYEQLPALAKELVQLKPSVIVTAGSPTVTQAAQHATRAIPIVMGTSTDPVASGFVASLSRPGGNITGLSSLTADLSPKRVDLLMGAVPKLSHVAVLVNPDNDTHTTVLANIETAARKTNIKVLRAEARSAQELEKAFAGMIRERAGAFILLADSFFNIEVRRIAELASANRLPSIGGGVRIMLRPVV